MARKIKTQTDHKKVILGGYYDGEHTYLHLWIKNVFIDIVSGKKLYKLAQNIVKEFEDKDEK